MYFRKTYEQSTRLTMCSLPVQAGTAPPSPCFLMRQETDTGTGLARPTGLPPAKVLSGTLRRDKATKSAFPTNSRLSCVLSLELCPFRAPRHSLRSGSTAAPAYDYVAKAPNLSLHIKASVRGLGQCGHCTSRPCAGPSTVNPGLALFKSSHPRRQSTVVDRDTDVTFRSKL